MDSIGLGRMRDGREAAFSVREAADQLVEAMHRGGLQENRDVVRALHGLQKRAAFSQLKIAILSDSEESKTGLVSELIETPEEEAGIPPSTTACTYLAYGQEPEASVTLRDNLTARFPIDQLADFLNEKSSVLTKVTIRLPSNALKNGLVVIDTPVLQGDAEAAYARVESALQDADACVLVLRAGAEAPKNVQDFLLLAGDQLGKFFVFVELLAEIDEGDESDGFARLTVSLGGQGGIPEHRVFLLRGEVTAGEEKARWELGSVLIHREILPFAALHAEVAMNREAEALAKKALEYAERAMRPGLGMMQQMKLRRATRSIQEILVRAEAEVGETKAALRERSEPRRMPSRRESFRRQLEDKSQRVVGRQEFAEREAFVVPAVEVPAVETAAAETAAAEVVGARESSLSAEVLRVSEVRPDPVQPVAPPPDPIAMERRLEAKAALNGHGESAEPVMGRGGVGEGTGKFPLPWHPQVAAVAGSASSTRASGSFHWESFTALAAPMVRAAGADGKSKEEAKPMATGRDLSAAPAERTQPVSETVALEREAHAATGVGELPLMPTASRWEDSAEGASLDGFDGFVSGLGGLRFLNPAGETLSREGHAGERLGSGRAGFLVWRIAVGLGIVAAGLFVGLDPQMASIFHGRLLPGQATTSHAADGSGAGSTEGAGVSNKRVAPPPGGSDGNREGISTPPKEPGHETDGAGSLAEKPATMAEPGGDSDEDGSLEAAIANWASTYRRGDMQAHLACYAPFVDTYFNMHNVRPEQILYEQERALKKTAHFERFDVTPIAVTDQGNGQETVSVKKEWKSANTDGTHTVGRDIEKLVLVRIDGNWKIVGEEEMKVLELRHQ